MDLDLDWRHADWKIVSLQTTQNKLTCEMSEIIDDTKQRQKKNKNNSPNMRQHKTQSNSFIGIGANR